MADKQAKATAVADRQAPAGAIPTISRGQLIELLNEDLAREYQAIIAYVATSVCRPRQRLTDNAGG